MSGYACEDIFVNNMDSIVVFDSAREGVSMFALFIRISCDASLHYHKIKYEHCGRMIELESHEDCEKSIERKQALVCEEYEDRLYRKITAIEQNDQADYDYWTVEITIIQYMSAMKIMKENRAQKQADMASQSLIEGQTELAELMAFSMIEDEEKDKSTRADAAIRKQRAKQAILKRRISKQLEQVELKEQQKVRQGNRTFPQVLPVEGLADKKQLLAQNKLEDAERSELARLAKEHEKNTKLKAAAETVRIQLREKEQEEALVLQQLAETEIQAPGADTANANDCCVCLEKTRNTLLLLCHHMCLCESCAADLMKNAKASCPLCRAKVQKTNKNFL